MKELGHWEVLLFSFEVKSRRKTTPHMWENTRYWALRNTEGVKISRRKVFPNSKKISKVMPVVIAFECNFYEILRLFSFIMTESWMHCPVQIHTCCPAILIHYKIIMWFWKLEVNIRSTVICKNWSMAYAGINWIDKFPFPPEIFLSER